TLAIALPVASPAWRSRDYAKTALVAFACALPFALPWCIAMPRRADFGQGPNLGLPYFLKLLPWYAWPAWPLAAWTLWRTRRTLPERPDLQVPLLVFVAFLLDIHVFGEPREVNAMPLLLPLAILGVAELETLPRGAASALDW